MKIMMDEWASASPLMRRARADVSCWLGSKQEVLCKLFNCQLWWSLLGLLDHLLCVEQGTGFTFSGGFYEKHNRDCPELR